MQHKATTKLPKKRMRAKKQCTIEFEAKLNEDAVALARLIYDLYKQQQPV